MPAGASARDSRSTTPTPPPLVPAGGVDGLFDYSDGDFSEEDANTGDPALDGYSWSGSTSYAVRTDGGGAAASDDGAGGGGGTASSGTDDAQSIEDTRDFLERYGKPPVVNYPAEQPCEAALSKGQYCVLGRLKRACQPGLICYRWKPGRAICQTRKWPQRALVREDIFQASAGCQVTQTRRLSAYSGAAQARLRGDL